MTEVVERIARIESAVEHIQQLLHTEVSHMDDIMALHRETHEREHVVYQESVQVATTNLERRLGEFRNAIDQFSTVLSTMAPRETIDSKFEAVSLSLMHLETSHSTLVEKVSAINDRVTVLATAKLESSKNASVWITIGISTFTVIFTMILTLLI